MGVLVDYRFPNNHRQRGFTLVGMLIMLGIVGLCAAMFLTVSNQSRIIKKVTAASMTPQEIEDILKADMITATRNFLKAGCYSSPSFSRALGAAGTELISKTGLLPTIAGYTPPTSHSDAAKRCASRPTVRAVGSGHAVYLCVGIRPPSGGTGPAIGSSVLDTQYIFAEFYLRPHLPQNNMGVTCQTIAANQQPPNTALEATYSMYWMVKDKHDFVPKQRTSYMITRVN